MQRLAVSRYQAGFTLIEVMVGFVLVLVLMVSFNALWTQVAGQLDDLVYRQKAIFRLNGEMERLVALYNADGVVFLGTESAVDYTKISIGENAGDYLSNSTSSNDTTGGSVRKIYGLGFPNIMSTAANGYIIDGLNNTERAKFTPGLPGDATTLPLAVTIYNYILANGNGNNARNLVWIDRSRDIVGQLSWDIYLMPNTDAGTPCYSGGCYFLTAYIDFPFRYNVTNNTWAPITGTPVDTITAQTIVGKVRP